MPLDLTDDLFDGLVNSAKSLDSRVDELERLVTPNQILVSSFSGLPGLRGLWVPSSVDEAGNLLDQSGQGRTLTYTGNPLLKIHNNRVPYFAYDGVGDWHTRPDEAGLDITGLEAYVSPAIQGVTFGAWFRRPGPGGSGMIISKRTTAGNQIAYGLDFSGATIRAGFSLGGATAIFAILTASAFDNVWLFGAGRYTTATTEIATFDGKKSIKSIQPTLTSLLNSNAPFMLGARDAGAALPLVGDIALAFICATALPDSLIQSLFNRTRSLFGV